MNEKRNDILTPLEFYVRMKELMEEPYDTEIKHIQMDALMCDLLRDLGYGAGVEIFLGTYKWYA